MKQNTLFIIIAMLVLVAGLVAAGCTQGSSTDSSPVAGSGSTASVAGSAGDGQQDTGQAGAAQTPVYSRQGRGAGQDFLTNESRLSATAAKLGIPEDTLRSALTGTTNSTTGRPDFAAAAQQLGITQQELTDAFGFPAGGFGNGTHTRGNWTGQPGQGPGGPPPGQDQSR